MERLPVSVPAAAGLNSTETVQDAAAANVVPQVVADLRNEEESVPVMVSDVSVTVAVPVFLTVTTCAAVVEPSAVDAKGNAVGEMVMVGELTTEGQLFTRLAAFTEPRPVAWSYPVVVE